MELRMKDEGKKEKESYMRKRQKKMMNECPINIESEPQGKRKKMKIGWYSTYNLETKREQD